jgi:ABC-2 type transport system ATP-binding protein
MLTIKNLSKTYDNGVKALNNINLTIDKGMFGLLGPNGAGKSSLMRTIATLQQPDDGEIIFNGNNSVDDPQLIRQHLGYLPQDFGVYPKISAFKLLDHMAVLKGLINKSERHEQVNALLQQTNLFQQKDKAVSTFSGGMRQRFGIAQALLGDPKLVIVDEPTAGLDPEERNRFHNLLSEIGESVVVILSTHIVEDVLDLCPKMAILAQGQIQQQGKPSELVSQLEGKIWRKTITKQTLGEYQASYNVISTHLFAGQTQIHVLSDDQPDTGFESLVPGLEDVYFSTLSAIKGAGHV